jgi:hypothetical protein
MSVLGVHDPFLLPGFAIVEEYLGIRTHRNKTRSIWRKCDIVDKLGMVP